MDIEHLEQIIKVVFTNKDIITEALTHKSFINESPHAKHNERLEFLGDAVLELVITRYLYLTYSMRPEGDLTSFRAALVRTESLSTSASLINLGSYMRMSKGEEATGGRTRTYILANAFEALLGAIYLDQGIEVVTDFINRHITIKIEEIVKNRLDIDAKSKLQEFVQERMKHTPQYKTIKEDGPDHDKNFTVIVVIGDKSFQTGEGKTKQAAEQNAALATLDLLKSTL